MLKISQKKNCNGCRALDGIYLNSSCLLGYKVETFEKNRHFGIYESRPLEPCPKPLRIEDYLLSLEAGVKK